MMTISSEQHAMYCVLFGMFVAGIGLWAGRNPAPNPPPTYTSYYHTPVYQPPPGQAWNTMCLWTGVFSFIIMLIRLPMGKFPRPKIKDLIVNAVTLLLAAGIIAGVMTILCSIGDEFMHEDFSM